MKRILARWRHRKRLPLRVTLVAAMLGLVTLALVVIGVAGSTLLQRYLLDRVDSQLRTTATQVFRSNGQVNPDAGGRYGVYPGGGLYVAATDSQGSNQGQVIFPSSATPIPKLPLVTSPTVRRTQRPLLYGQLGFGLASVAGSGAANGRRLDERHRCFGP